MIIRKGDILRCIKNFSYPGDRTCTKGKSYKVMDISEDDNGVIVEIMPDEKKQELGVSMNKDCDRNDHEYIYDYFEKKTDRAKRIINEYKKR